jgi:hypothetical protein
MRHRAALAAALLAVQEDARMGAEAARRVEIGRGQRQVGGAEARQRHRREVVLVGGAVPEELLSIEVAAGADLQRRLVDDEAGDEGALGAIGPDDAGGVADFLVHQHRDGAVAVVEHAQAVRDADHAIGRCAVELDAGDIAGGQQRGEGDAGFRGDQVGRGGSRGTDGHGMLRIAT